MSFSDTDPGTARTTSHTPGGQRPGGTTTSSAEETDVLELVAKALQGIRFGEVAIVVVNGQVDRIDRVHKSRPYRARRDHRD